MEAGLDEIRRAPGDDGVLKLLVSRPQTGERRVLGLGELSLAEGLIGDGWKNRPNSKKADGSPCVEMQLTVMNSRAIALLAMDSERWPLAGDQLFIDLDLSVKNLPAGTQLAIGTAVIEFQLPTRAFSTRRETIRRHIPRRISRRCDDWLTITNSRHWIDLHITEIMWK